MLAVVLEAGLVYRLSLPESSQLSIIPIADAASRTILILRSSENNKQIFATSRTNANEPSVSAGCHYQNQVNKSLYIHYTSVNICDLVYTSVGSD
jgi:hypothetical protein